MLRSSVGAPDQNLTSSTESKERQNTPAVEPGQAWTWQFSVETGSWPAQIVTERARHVAFSSGFIMLQRDDVFTIICVDDPGPARLPVIPVETDFTSLIPPATKRWHVVLVQGVLVWFEHDWFLHSELLHELE